MLLWAVEKVLQEGDDVTGLRDSNPLGTDPSPREFKCCYQ
jgi:hypothetical protein